MNIEDMTIYGVGTMIVLLLLYWAWPYVLVALAFYGMYELFRNWIKSGGRANGAY